MVRFFVCPKTGLNRGAWTPEEDTKLSAYVTRYGHWNWRELPKHAGLSRCGKSCRLRWMNYLRPNIKRGNYTREEEELIINLHEKLGNKWSAIAARLPGRTDNEIKNHWHSRLRTQTKPRMTFKDARKKPSVKCDSVTNIVHPGNLATNSSESWASSISDCKGEIVDQAATDEIELSFNPLSEFDKYILDETLLGEDSYMPESSTSEENEISSSDSVLEFDESFGIESFLVKETFTPENFISATTEISPSSISDFDANIWSRALLADDSLIPENSTSDLGEVSSGSVTEFDAVFWTESLSIGESLTPESNQSDVSEISMDSVLGFDENFSVGYPFTPGNSSSDESEISSDVFLELMEELYMPEDNTSVLVDPSLLHTFSPLGEALYP